METDTVSEVAVAPITEDEDDKVHIVCCMDENVALCGMDLTSVDWVEDADSERDCQTCERLVRVGCPVDDDGWCEDCPAILLGI